MGEAVGTNPSTVSTAGQPQRTVNVGWIAGPDFTYCEIYLSVNNAQWSDFGKGGQGNSPATISRGSSYTFRMMVYEGQQGTPKIIKTVTVSGVP